MKINVLRHEGNELRIELVGEGHSFCNALQSVLLKDETLEFVGYNMPHPLVGQPTIYVRTKERRDPWIALLNAAKALDKELSQIQRTFQEAWKDETDISQKENK
ncbi:DNA-directed RNA polymerase subunit L [Candidatus Bathyarchaeota archaeon]|nr:DNA-directed RNA polymerase subunit L [Candidatus Bathyarchaeota archaeon]